MVQSESLCIGISRSTQIAIVTVVGDYCACCVEQTVVESAAFMFPSEQGEEHIVVMWVTHADLVIEGLSLIYPRVCTVCYDDPWQTVRRRNPLRSAACSSIFWPCDELETSFYYDISGATKTAEYIRCNFVFLRTKKKGTAYVQKCRSCRMNELSQHAKSGEI